jgi:subfamily B ATP-binding cassette protein MsbA
MTHTRTTGTFISFIAALLLAYEPLKKLVHLNTELQEGLSALSRLFGVLDTVPQVVDAPDAFSLKVSEGAIEIQDISFRYSDEAPLFKNLSLSITGGQKTAIVGPSGSGKSTLFNLLLRFYDVVAGKITIDAQPLDKVTLASLREKIAFVGQEIVLFNETILENIHYGRRDATFDQVVDAARAADAHDFIEALPKGYHTKIGEHGLKLSGGQRQRIAIARAMLKDAPLLLLDEATSSLDSQSETYVQKALERLMEGRTTLTIAHRLSTVERADKIFVLDRGEVVEEGNHDSLLNAGGLYARLVFPQLSE